jgi:hypothetical protein
MLTDASCDVSNKAQRVTTAESAMSMHAPYVNILYIDYLTRLSILRYVALDNRMIECRAVDGIRFVRGN